MTKVVTIQINIQTEKPTNQSDNNGKQKQARG